jgi:predicted dinucleotide-binding enzyme
MRPTYARHMTAETPIDPIGIIGAGHAGQAFARVAQRAGRGVVIANNQGPKSLAAVVAALGTGVSAGTVGEAAASPTVVIAVPWASVPEAVANQVWEAKIVVDQTNAYLFPEMTLADLGGRSSSEIVAELVEGARVVKAGNTLCRAPRERSTCGRRPPCAVPLRGRRCRQGGRRRPLRRRRVLPDRSR